MAETYFTTNKILGMVGAVLLVLIGVIATWYMTFEWSKPYIQYQESSYYKPGTSAVTSLRLDNLGRSDAEEVRINAVFPAPITDITISDQTLSLNLEQGGKGFKTVVATIPRIAPSQSTYIYFAINNEGDSVGDAQPNFVKRIAFKGGLGNNKPPFFNNLLYSSLGVLIGIVSTALTTLLIKYKTLSMGYKGELDQVYNLILETDKRFKEIKEETDKKVKEINEQSEKHKEKS